MPARRPAWAPLLRRLSGARLQRSVRGGPVNVGHVGVPSFRGLDRRTVPRWFLLAMRRSVLFTRQVIRTATAMVWFYAGADRDRRAVHPDDLTPAAALTIMAESLSKRGTGPADRSLTLTTLAGRSPSWAAYPRLVAL